jgi:hypothetical protein
MTTPVLGVLHNNHCLDDADFITSCLATNASKNFIVVEALAGTGKTTLLLDVVRRLDLKRCLVLSFSRNAIRVIKVRVKKQTGEWAQTQTFDSLFLHLHGKKAKLVHPEPTFQTYRDMVVETTREDIRDFVCRTREVNYCFDDFDYLFVDEAQDSPPGSFHFLDLCRKHGKQIVITGDRHQAIFQFQDTVNLFDQIPRSRTVLHKLTTTRRLSQPLCEFANARWGLDMRSGRDPEYKNDNLDISIQCRLNKTLGQVYVHLLTTLGVHIKVNIEMDSSGNEDGESNPTAEKFIEAAWQEIQSKYGVGPDKAKEILSVLESRSRRCKGPWIVLTSVHRYKGDESDLTVLGPDIDVTKPSEDVAEENVKYVAWTRARFGVLQLAVPGYLGDQQLMERASSYIQRRTLFRWPCSVSQMVRSPVVTLAMMGNVHLRRAIDLVRACYQEHHLPLTPTPCHTCDTKSLVGTACDVALCWYVERQAFVHGAQVLADYPEFAATVKTDKKIRTMLANNKIPQSIVRAYARLIRRAKAAALLCRHLVIRHGFPLDHTVVVRGVLAQAVLQNFAHCRRVTVLKHLVHPPRCCALDYRGIIGQCIDAAKLPPVLRDASQWQGVSIHGNTDTGEPQLLDVRGTFDVVIYDRQSVRHLLEFKCVQRLQFAHFWQTAMYSVLSTVNMGIQMHRTYVFSIRDRSLFELRLQHLAEMAQILSAHADEFNKAIRCSADTQFYPKEYELDDLAF